MLKPTVTTWTLMLSLALAVSGCGRVLQVASAPPQPLQNALKGPLPLDPAMAIDAACAALPGAYQPGYVAAYGVRGDGRLVDSVRSGWVVGLMGEGPNAGKAAMVTIAWDGATQIAPAKFATGPSPTVLKPGELKPMKQAITWAHQAGLPLAPSYQVAYLSTAHGPGIAVAQRDATTNVDAARNADTEDSHTIVIDPATGKPLAPAKVEETSASAITDGPESVSAWVAHAIRIRMAF